VTISKARRPGAPAPAPETPVFLTPAVFHVLLALADGPSHGYGIMQEVDEFTAGSTRLGPGTLYRSIQRMLVDSLIEELAIAAHDESDDDRRRYYRLTPKGLATAKAEAQRLADLVDAAQRRKLLAKPTTSLLRRSRQAKAGGPRG
jgi:DNA-binding PadR family transcriptional regulator